MFSALHKKNALLTQWCGSALSCGILSIILSYPMAIVMALLYRFPIPLGGYIGPFSKVGIEYHEIINILLMVSVAWIFYGIFSGFVVLGLADALVGQIIFNMKSAVNELLVATVISFMACFFLAILDFMIGPW